MIMASCDIQIGNSNVLSKIESFLNDASYREAIENSANYNTRLCIERRLRMPFLDSQTGVAQNHSNLFMSPRQRIPGLLEGQIYTYPSKRWRKKRRQYLMNFMQPKLKELDPEGDMHTITTVENPAACNEDSKDSVALKEDSSKEAWYYDELDYQEMEAFEDPDPDSDYDYEETYSRRRKKPRRTARNADSPASKRGKGPGRGRRRAHPETLPDPVERGSARRGRHSSQPAAPPPDEPPPEKKPMPSQVMTMMPEDKERASASPYCDFCLGDASENKKTGLSEELVSCSDCGRSGHPTCLQFTPNMIVSVCKYRWQCIECKCCSLCGTSDNDDQLLFCDDCDRGYHMYCLVPPLTTPPEGTWSCHLCIALFHNK
ncbi:zinc finger protein DPF3 [Anabrus simplex]|uniref:zinc finger protein DPF3 n=1 Tax=Anabrus simplex TaxID=316456 RepID=UPI0034DD841F